MSKKIKNFISVLFLVGLTSSTLFAAEKNIFTGNTGKGKRVLVDESIVKNGDNSDKWLSEKLKTDFINDLLNYSELDVINSDDSQKILELQRESESETYEQTVIEIGKRIQAESYISLVTTKYSDGYTASVSIVNITTGKVEYGYSIPKKYNVKDFENKAHRELALAILEDGLNVELTTNAKMLLLDDKGYIFAKKQKKRNSFGVEASMSQSKDISIVYAGIVGTVGILKNLYIGAEGSVGVPINSGKIFASTSFNYNPDFKENPLLSIKYTGVGIIGTNISVLDSVRISAFGEVGLVNSTIGAGIGISAEYFVKYFGIYGTLGLTWDADDGFLNKYSLVLEFPFNK